MIGLKLYLNYDREGLFLFESVDENAAEAFKQARAKDPRVATTRRKTTETALDHVLAYAGRKNKPVVSVAEAFRRAERRAA